MKMFDVSYERHKSEGYWPTFATERIKARGIIHAHKLANDHLKALRTLDDGQIRIQRVDEVKDDV